MDNIVVVDFSGTLTKPVLAEEANERRLEQLGLACPDEAEHKHQHATKGHYDVIRSHIERKFGVSDGMKVSYVNNFGEEVELSGKDVKTMIMTDLFRDANYSIAAEKGLQIFADGMIEVLQKVQKKGYKLAIVSGTRTDIITGLFAITKYPLRFDFVLGQDPVLSRDDSNKLLDELKSKGRIAFIIGDKMSDIEPAKRLGAKSVFVKWGHPTGGEEEFADFAVSSAEEIDRIIV